VPFLPAKNLLACSKGFVVRCPAPPLLAPCRLQPLAPCRGLAPPLLAPCFRAARCRLRRAAVLPRRRLRCLGDRGRRHREGPEGSRRLRWRVGAAAG